MSETAQSGLRDALIELGTLASIEKKIQEYQWALEAFQKEVTEGEKEYRLVEDQLKNRKEELAQLEEKDRFIQESLSLSQQKTQERQAKLNSIKTNKEFQAANREISTAKQLNQQMEKELTLLSETLRKMKEETVAIEERFLILQESVNSQKAQFEERDEAIRRNLAGELVSKKELFARLDLRLVQQYEKISSRRQPAVAAVLNGTCQECFMNVAPQLFIEIQKFSEIVSCPSCSRILYLPNEDIS